MEHTLLLLHGEELIDSSGRNVPLTNQGVQISSTQSKFGGRSLYFNGNSKILFPYKTQINFGSNNFTVDWWEYTEPGSGSRFSTSWENWGGLLLGYTTTKVYCGSAVNTWNLISGADMFNNEPNKWVHWAVVRNGNVLTTYKNGKKFAQSPLNGGIWEGTGNGAIGAYTAVAIDPFKGYIDEFRISDVARWTSDFIPPTEPYGGKPDFSYEMQVPVGSSKKVYARLYPKNPDDYFQTDLTKATVDLTVRN